jgi:GTP-binding protein
MGKPYAVSALHGRHLSELYKEIHRYLSGLNRREAGLALTSGQDEAVKIAVVGRPNVGKSSFINCIINQERLLVDDLPGTTRDSVDVIFKRDKSAIVLVDTAGMKHKKKIKEVVEIFSMARTKQSIRRCDVALIIIDAVLGLNRDDIAVIDYIIKQGKAVVLLVNKKDLIRDLNTAEYRKELCARYRPISWMPVLFTSCKEKQNIIKALDVACAVFERSKIKFATHTINELLENMQKTRPHPSSGRIKPKISYATQAGTRPLRFLLFSSNPKRIKTDYVRFIESQFRRRFELSGIPIFFELRQK